MLSTVLDSLAWIAKSKASGRYYDTRKTDCQSVLPTSQRVVYLLPLA